MKFSLPSLWSEPELVPTDPFRTVRRDMERLMRVFDRDMPSGLAVGAGVPAINIAESPDKLEVSAELPGVDQKDIKINLDGNRLVISGEKKEESDEEGVDWHVVERSYGAFHRSIALPFEPDESKISAHFDKGVLHVLVNKPAQAITKTKTIEVKAGPAPQISSQQKSGSKAA